MTGLILPSYHGGHREDVLHACPECQTGRPSPFCQTCGGKGLVDERALAKWQRRVLAAG